MKQKQKHRQPSSLSNAPYVPHISRTAVVRADAQHRWDYVYQLLLRWGVATEPPKEFGEFGELANQYGPIGQEDQEDCHVNRNRPLCSRLDQPSAPEPNAER